MRNVMRIVEKSVHKQHEVTEKLRDSEELPE